MIPAGERIPSGDPSYFLAKYSYKQGNRKKVGAKPGREDQSEEGCRSFATQTGGTAPSPPSTPSFVLSGIGCRSFAYPGGGRQMPFPPTAFGFPTLRPTSPPVCPRSPSGFPFSGFRFPLFVCFGGGGARSVWAGLGPLPAPLPGFGFGAGVACPGRFLVLLPVSASRSCLSWAFVRGVRPGRVFGLLGCGRGRFAVRVLCPLVLFRSCGST